MKRRTRRKQGVNLLNLAQSAVIANATTEGLFGTNLAQFLTGSIDGQFRPGGDGYSRITLPELIGFSSGGWSASKIGGNYGSKTFMDALKFNFNKNGAQMIGTLVVVPVAFKFAEKLTAKPRRDANKLLKMAGLSSVVKV